MRELLSEGREARLILLHTINPGRHTASLQVPPVISVTHGYFQESPPPRGRYFAKYQLKRKNMWYDTVKAGEMHGTARVVV